MGKLIDLTGQRFGSWVVVCRDYSSCSSAHDHPIPMWLCRCDCGTISSVAGTNLRAGRSTCCHKCRDKKRTAGLRRYHRTAARLRNMFPGEFEI